MTIAIAYLTIGLILALDAAAMPLKKGEKVWDHFLGCLTVWFGWFFLFGIKHLPDNPKAREEDDD